MTMLATNPARTADPAVSDRAAATAQIRQIVVRDDVPCSYAGRLDGLVVWSTRDLARYGLSVSLQAAALYPPLSAPEAPDHTVTRSAAEVAAAVAAIDTRPLSLDDAMAECGFTDAGPISGSWQSEERRLPRLR